MVPSSDAEAALNEVNDISTQRNETYLRKLAEPAPCFWSILVRSRDELDKTVRELLCTLSSYCIAGKNFEDKAGPTSAWLPWLGQLAT